MLFLDLDRFKYVNDTRGHSASDEVLGVIAARLRETVRATDTVSRFAGDEFVVVPEYVGTAEEVLELASRIAHGLRSRSTYAAIRSCSP